MAALQRQRRSGPGPDFDSYLRSNSNLQATPKPLIPYFTQSLTLHASLRQLLDQHDKNDQADMPNRHLTQNEADGRDSPAGSECRS